MKLQKFEANYFIWTLSRQETEYLCGPMANERFATPAPEPMWTWLRYRFHFKPSRLLENAPRAFIVIDDLYLSWTHDNFLALVRADSEKDAVWDVWLKLAYHRRSDKSYLQSLGMLAELKLKSRISGLETSHVEFPQTFHYDNLAPSPYCIYEPSHLHGIKKVKNNNFYFAGTESQEHMDWTGFFERQNQILQDIITDVVREREKAQTQYKPQELR